MRTAGPGPVSLSTTARGQSGSVETATAASRPRSVVSVVE